MEFQNCSRVKGAPGLERSGAEPALMTLRNITERIGVDWECCKTLGKFGIGHRVGRKEQFGE